MKVCTDSCLFGAWIADSFSSFINIEKRILDIGTGTGLLSLMMAQKNNGTIDALEIDKEAALQASENILLSPWHHHIQVLQKSLQEFQPYSKYDVIISNPPFFEGDLKSKTGNKNNAKHDTSLTLDYLVDFIFKYLKKEGKAAIMIPFHRRAYFEKIIKSFFVIEKIAKVRQSPNHHYFRAMYIISYPMNHQVTEEFEICIRNHNGQYDPRFIELLRDYYLNL